MKSNILGKEKKRKSAIKNTYLYLMLIPGVIFFIIFKYVPMAGIVIAFKDFKIMEGMTIFNAPNVGFAHFTKMFGNSFFWSAFANTLILSLLTFFLGMPVPIVFAILLNEVMKKAFRKTVQTIVYLPHFVSWVIFSGIIFQLFNEQSGLVNYIIRAFGGSNIAFMEDTRWWRVIYVGSDILKGFGWSSIVFYAAIVAVDQEMYEAARIDGASRFQRIWHITMPNIAATITIMLILQIGKITSVSFDQVYTLSTPRVYSVSEVISTYVYRNTIGVSGGMFPQFSYGAAIGIFQSIISLVLIVLSDRISKMMGQKGII